MGLSVILHLKLNIDLMTSLNDHFKSHQNYHDSRSVDIVRFHGNSPRICLPTFFFLKQQISPHGGARG